MGPGGRCGECMLARRATSRPPACRCGLRRVLCWPRMLRGVLRRGPGADAKLACCPLLQLSADKGVTLKEWSAAVLAPVEGHQVCAC